MKKKILSLVLSVLMVVTMLPTYALPALADGCTHILNAADVAAIPAEFWTTHSASDYYDGSSALIGARIPASCTTDGWELAKTADSGFCIKCGNYLVNGAIVADDDIATTATVLPKTGHDFTDETKKQTDATCTAAATYMCKNTNTSYSKKKVGTIWTIDVQRTACNVVDSVGSPLGHDEQGPRFDNLVDCHDDGGVIVADSCAKDGTYDEVMFCGRSDAEHGSANKELSRTHKTAPALAHTPNHVLAVAATCADGGKAGNIEYWECTACGKLFSDEAMTNEITAADTVVAAPAHAWVKDDTKSQAATCFYDGFDFFECSNCHETKTTPITKLTHEVDTTQPVTVVQEKTCTKDGITEAVCKHCGTTFTTTDAATGHNYVENTALNKAATCTTDGYTYYECTVCGDFYKDPIAAIGHNYQLVATAHQDPTCTEAGFDTYECQNCQDTYKDPIAALGHNWQYDSTVAPTCENDGYDLYVCQNDANHTEQRNPVAAVGHNTEVRMDNFVNCHFDAASGEVVADNCDESLTYSYDTFEYCLNTDAQHGTDHEMPGTRETHEVTRLAHDFNITHAVYPTCTQTGEDHWQCVNCGKFVIESVPALGHQWALTDVATCVNGDLFACTRGDIDPTTGTPKTDGYGNVIPCPAVYEDEDSINYDVTFTANSGLEVDDNGDAVDYRDSNNAPYFDMQTGNQTGNTKFEIPEDELADLEAEIEGKIPVFVSTTGAFDAATAVDYGTDAVENTITIDVDGAQTITYTSNRLRTGHTYTATKVEARCEYDAYYIVTCNRTKTVFGTDRTCAYPDAPTAENEAFVVVLPNTATGHKWSLRDDDSNIDPTCTKDGERHWVCLNDHNHQYTEAIPATGHNWVLDKSVPATCCTDGYDLYVCVNQAADNDLDSTYGAICGETYKVYTEPATGNHKFEITHTDATCTTEGFDTYKCVNTYEDETGATKECGYEYTVATTPALGHDYQVISSTAATCTTEGYDTYKCSRCTETYNVTTTPALGHEYQITEKTPATCTTEGKQKYECIRCDAEYEEITTPALGHEYKVTGTVAATCTTEGYDTYTCVRCDSTYNKKTTPATGHQYVATSFVAPTCTTDGYTVYTCANDGCTATYNGDYIPSLNHEFVVDSTTPATCTAQGYDTYKCTRCDVTYNKVTTAALGHEYKITASVDATCTAEGYDTYTCDRCGATYNKTTTAIADHDYSSVVTTQPTCGAAGVITYTCSVCNASYTEEIPATGDHKYVAEVTTQPTCVAKGVMTYTCSVCGASYTEEIEENDDHQYSETVTTPATCLEDGVMTHTCDLCGENYTTVIPALGHDWLRTTYTRPTCIDCGYYTYVCSRCGATRTEESFEPATGHDYVKTIKAATTKKAGKIVEKCKNCGDTKTTAIPRIVTITLSQKEFVYTGKKINPLVTITNADGKKITTNNYDVKYENNVNIGKAKVTITFKNHYAGTVTRTFKIIPKTAGISEITSPSKGSIKFTWGRVKVCDGYQIQYATSSDFSGAKSITVTGQKSCTKTITGLKSGKKYYIRVRAYKLVDGKKIYGNWATTSKKCK